MSKLNATVIQGSDVNPRAIVVGIQGPPGTAATQNSISLLHDVDSSATTNGSVLVYRTVTNKWTSTTTLDAQNMEGGEF